MPKLTAAFTDSSGRLHATPEGATVSDLAQLFGSAEGMAVGIARDVMAKRDQIEKILNEYDEVKMKATLV